MTPCLVDVDLLSLDQHIPAAAVPGGTQALELIAP